ncbi:MAG TPA: hypothetical protein VK464_26895 [Symbiobacteriaceae bacterium]|nr:hypothetical protein [Symbiobacteriaceae bacterium]
MWPRNWLPVLAAAAILTVGVAGAFHGLSVNASTTSKTAQAQVAVAPGYTISVVAGQFTAPVGAAPGPGGEVYVAEAGARAIH